MIIPPFVLSAYLRHGRPSDAPCTYRPTLGFSVAARNLYTADMSYRRSGHDAGRRAATITLLLMAWLAQAGAAAAIPRYQMFVDVDYDRGTFAGELVVTYENATSLPLDDVFFRLYGNAHALYGSAFLAVREVRVNGDIVSTALLAEDTVLSVRLPEPLAPGASAEIALSFSGAAALPSWRGFSTETEYGLLFKGDRTFTLTAFYPMVAPMTGRGWATSAVDNLGDAVFADCADYDVVLRVDSGVEVVPPADSRYAEPDGRTIHVFHRDALRDFSLVLLDDGRSGHDATASGVTVRTWFSAQHAEAGMLALEQGAGAVDAFSAVFGALPLESVDVVEVPLQRVAGVELAGLILVSADYAAAPRDPFFSVIVSHEMAHQWFYATVGSDPVWEPWLDEALATYASYLYLATAAPDVAQSQKSTWGTLYDRARRDYPALSVTSPSVDFPDPATYSAFVYSGGALELDALRSALGDSVFFGSLADYYSAHALAIADGGDLLAAFRSACGCAVSGPLFPAQPAAP
jgi:hypothetical protein